MSPGVTEIEANISASSSTLHIYRPDAAHCCHPLWGGTHLPRPKHDRIGPAHSLASAAIIMRIRVSAFEAASSQIAKIHHHTVRLFQDHI